MKNNLSGSYYLANDIDCSATSSWNYGQGFIPIGNSSTYFRGTFDGRGYKITGLYVNRLSTDYVGLFGRTYGATIKNVGVENNSITGKSYVGGLVGRNYYSSIKNSYATGSVTGRSFEVGGLVGYNDNYSSIKNSYATGSVSGDCYVGGLVGINYGSSSIENSYATGSVTGSVSGGLVGHNSSSSTTTASYWDMQTSGQSSSAGGVGKTTAQMKTQSTFSGWDFSSVWCMPDGDYPRLKWEDVCITCTGCAVRSGNSCVAGSSCSGETPTCSVSGTNGICVCNSGSCNAGRKCSGTVCVNCGSSEGCGACGCGTSQKPTGAGSCLSTNSCCPGECNAVTGANSCSYSDALCAGSACNRTTLSCCASSLPYWRSSACKACSTTSGLSGTCTTKGMTCNSSYNCVTCAANEQCTCPSGQRADGFGGCISPVCSSNTDCNVEEECVNPGSFDSYCSNCRNYNKIWHNGSCEACPANSTYTEGVCLCSGGKIWNKSVNSCLDRGVLTSSGDVLSLKRNNSNSATGRYDRIKSRMNRIRSKIQNGTGDK